MAVSIWKRLGFRVTSDASGTVGAFESDDAPYTTAPAAHYPLPERSIAVGTTLEAFPASVILLPAAGVPYCSDLYLEMWRTDGVLDATVVVTSNAAGADPANVSSLKFSKAAGLKARMFLDGLSTALSPGEMVVTVKSNSGTTYIRGYAAK